MPQLINQHWFRYCLVAWSAPSHYRNQWWNIINWNLRNKLQWNLKRNSYIFIQDNAFENVVWKMAAILPRPQWVKDIKVVRPWNCFIFILGMSILLRRHFIYTRPSGYATIFVAYLLHIGHDSCLQCMLGMRHLHPLPFYLQNKSMIMVMLAIRMHRSIEIVPFHVVGRGHRNGFVIHIRQLYFYNSVMLPWYLISEHCGTWCQSDWFF